MKRALMLGITVFLLVFVFDALFYRYTPGEKVYYLKDTTLASNNYLRLLRMIESDNEYETRRSWKDKKGKTHYSEYWGAYQLGESAREEIGIEHVSWEVFKKHPEIQDAAIRLHILRCKYYLESYQTKFNTPKINLINKYQGKIIGHCYITESGLLGMVHNCGIGSVKNFLFSGGEYLPVDGGKTKSISYLSLSNYNIDFNEQEALNEMRKVLKKVGIKYTKKTIRG